MKINYIFMIILGTSMTIKAWPPALQNCGNTCFMNATIQVLYNTPPLTKHIIETNPLIQNNAVVNLYSKLINDFEKNKEGLSPKKFKCEGELNDFVKNIQNLNYNLCGAQEDAIEFMREFLNQLKSAFPNIHQFYQCNETSLVSCPMTKLLPSQESQTSFSIDIFELPIEIEKNKIEYIPLENLESCLSSYFHAQELEEYSGRKDCLKTLFIENPKEILFLSLKRFRYEKEKQARSKLTHTVSIPFTLNIKEYLKNSTQNNDYQLIGAIVQSGTLESGHYWAYVQDLSGQWYKCDDASITKITAQGNSMMEEINGAPNKPTGYLFVYQKTSSRKKSQAEFERTKKEREQKEQQQMALANLTTALNTLTQTLAALQKSLGIK